jgi:hypothetical protein
VAAVSEARRSDTQAELANERARAGSPRAAALAEGFDLAAAPHRLAAGAYRYLFPSLALDRRLHTG